MTCTLGPRCCEGRRCMAWQRHPKVIERGRCVHVHAARAQAIAAERVAHTGVGALREMVVDLQTIAMAAQTMTALEPGSALLELLRMKPNVEAEVPEAKPNSLDPRERLDRAREMMRRVGEISGAEAAGDGRYRSLAARRKGRWGR